ncbi:class IV adenylate cyclase [Ferruginibacter yonginensis]|uniref:Class IV adenylate cyclase n=1 Tax=Ferruginibacter yonginensis TaxID=1310416 RepID=A0ABV8QMY7_9BACT
MTHLNIEFKARAHNLESLEAKLLTLNPRFIGTDHQKDTYYNVTIGRLKLREGNIENALIWYDRANSTGSKQSDILLYKHQPDDALKKILLKLHGIKIIVEKARKIYFVDNVKFHFDRVQGLGTFLEVEAIDDDGSISKQQLQTQCDHYINFFEVQPADFITVSYSDMMLAT